MAYETIGLPFQVDTIRTNPCFFGNISRATAEKYLQQRGTSEGTFLVRESENGLRLSVLCLNNLGECNVIHYIIKENSNKTFCIDRAVTFPTVMSLIKYYHGRFTDMEQCLTMPCPQHGINESVYMTPSEWSENEIGEKAVKWKTLLRTGLHANVWKAQLTTTGEDVIIKTLSEDDGESEKFLLNECLIVKKLQNKNIVKLIGQGRQDPIFVAYEFCPLGNLAEFLEKSNPYQTVQKKNQFCLEISDALKFVFESGCVHRNIRASNVLLTSNCSCKLAGFGQAGKLNSDGIYLEDEDDKPVDKNAIRWMAPEVLDKHESTKNSDIWSFACTIVEIFNNGEVPYSDVFTSRVLKNVKNGDRPSRPASLNFILYHLLLKAWNIESNKRPKLEEFQNVMKGTWTPDHQQKFDEYEFTDVNPTADVLKSPTDKQAPKSLNSPKKGKGFFGKITAAK